MTFDHSEQVESDDMLNLTSMIDVVFTLLAFFIITVRVFGVEQDAVVAAAPNPLVEGLEAGDLPESLMIRLLDRPDAQEMLIIIGGHSYSSAQAITQTLREVNLPQVPVVFAAAPTVSVEQVTSAVDAALQSPMRRVSLRQATADELRWGGP